MTFALIPRRCNSFPIGEFTNLTASIPNLSVNFLQPLCGIAVTSTISRTDFQTASCRQIFIAQIQINIKLIARQFPIFFFLGKKRNDARVHYIELHFGMPETVRRARTSASFPIISDQTQFQIKNSFFQNFAFIFLRSATINSKTPLSNGDFLISSKPASSSSIVKCFIFS